MCYGTFVVDNICCLFSFRCRFYLVLFLFFYIFVEEEIQFYVLKRLLERGLIPVFS